jgi:ribosomal protein S3
MGQKTNPNILRLGTTKNWKYKYLEKKTSEQPFYDFNNIEIHKFINKFSKDNKFYVNDCKINYSDNNTLQIFISYYAEPNLNHSFENEPFKEQISYKILNYVINFTKIKNKRIKFLKRNLKLFYLNNLRFNRSLLEKKTINQINTQIKPDRIDIYTKKLSESLQLFLKSPIKLNITVQQLNKNLIKKLDRKELKIIKKKLSKFDRYKKNEFFIDGINILYICLQKANSANLLSYFITTQLPKLKRHNFFFRFIKDFLKTFMTNKSVKLQGVKIKIKGRINRRPRAKHKFLKIGKELPVISINSKIDYSEKVAYTPNGTMGVKVWTF